MPALSLKIILEDGAVTRTMKFPNGCTVADAAQMVEEKVLTGAAGKDYGLFLTSADDELSGCWLEDPQRLDYYLLKDGDSLQYRCRVRTLRIRMLDGAVKTMQVDESKSVDTLMMNVCAKLGITNYEEYGLCREDEPMDEQPTTGTLTLKRKHQHKEKDAALQQLSKKLKTDDNVEWLEKHKTLREMAVAPTETLLLKRRLFYSDRKVDARDPVQLNLLYVQARDAVLEGRHPVTEELAVKFAGIQCQVQYGDYQDEKHKHGFIENLSEFLPQNYANARGMEKKIMKEHKEHAGLTQLEAKHLYTKTARDLPSYGVTFFLVKEMQKGKKKLVPRLLGINASAILRLDETTKEILQTWPLTQVKTYKAGKGEMFTLNFGDYSEKEYCVKTNDAYRIRDILQGYIDLHRKRLEAAFNNSGDEGGVIHMATVESGKGSTMEVVSHSAHKTVETSFVGPSKMISAEEGSKAQAHGAQIVTAHTVIVTNKQLNEQSAKASGVTMRGEMSINTGRKLNDLNANAVKIVTLLNDPNETNIEAAKQIIETIVRDMPTVVAGVQHCIDQQTDEAARKKLTMELNELSDNVNQLNGFLNPQDAQEAAMRIADLTTQMYFALDGPSRKRSQLIRNSRKSFIEDEKTQATLHRASFINCVGAANNAMDDARDILATKYEGIALSPQEVDDLERSACDRLARLNAAIARLAAAHADPKNIDYAAAVSAMNTIKELVPKLAKDCQILSAVKDGKDRTGLIREMQELITATGMISQNIGCDDSKKMHDEADNFAKKSRRLQFIFGHGVHPDMENEIIDLTKDVDDKTRLLVATVSQLASEANDPTTPKVIYAAHKCANAASGLSSCAQLTAPVIQEPHCRSAFLAALEDLASSEKLLDAAFRSLPDHQDLKQSDDVKNQSAELRKALERLRNVCEELENDYNGDEPEVKERKRLRFITSMSGAQKSLDSCSRILKDKYKGQEISPEEADKLEHAARKKLDKLNAAIARLAAAHADPNNIDYVAAASAMATINELGPELAKDAQALSTVNDGKDRRSLIKEMQELLDATGIIYQSLGSEDLQTMQNATNAYTKKAKRLQFTLGNDNAGDLERRREQFATNLTGLQATAEKCDNILADNSNQQLSTLPKRPLWFSLGELNVAIGNLLAAVKDKENPDYEMAEAAMVHIGNHMPQVIEEMKRQSASFPPAKREKVRADIQALIDAVRAMAVHTKNGEDINQAMADYAKAAGGLTYIFDTHASQAKEHELIDLAKKVCSTTSELLAHVYGVAAEVGGEAGYDLDITGSKVAESAQDLLTAVQLTAPTIHVTPCKTMVLQSADDLSDSLDNVTKAWPAACNKDDKIKLDKMKLQADADLQKLKDAVQNVGEPTESPLDNKRKDLQGALLRAQDVIKQPLSSKPLTPAEEKTIQQSLAKKLAALNAAIAGLMNASYGRDPSKTDDTAAESSIAVIEKLLPEVIEDVRALNSGKSDAETRALMDELQALCAATNMLASESGHGNPSALKSFADQYSKSSGRLTFICTPTTAAQENHGQVIHKAQGVFDRSSMMVAAVDKLVKSNPNDFRNKAVDEKAQLVERAACALLGTAQVTASTVDTPQCRSALHQAARDLSSAISELDTATHQLVGADLLGQQRKNFDEAVRELMATISGLEEDSKHLNASAKTMSAEKEKNRLKFVASRSAAQAALDSALEELKKTGKVAPLAPPQAALLQARLADKLATLNAAIATLLSATRDPENPDYVLAESATATIQELVPDLIKDAKTLPSGKDQSARPKLLEQLQELCEATKAISSGDNSGKENELQDAVEKYIKASGKLVYTFNPRSNAAKEDQIIDLTKSTCQKTSELLERVYDLEQGLEGQAAVDLDAQGSRLADAAQNLLTTAEITARSISSPLCQSSLLTSVSALSSSVDHLFSSPVLTLPQHAAKKQHMQEARAKVDQEIERLKEALKDERVLDAAAVEKAKKEKLCFIASMASTEVAIQNAEKEITEPYGKPLPGPAVASLQDSLKHRLAALNAAINSLVVATSDRSNQDYLEAESISKTIRELIPDIVRDSKSLSSTMDPDSRKHLLDQIKALCEATRLLGASTQSEQFNPEELNKAATKFSLASNKLNFVFNPQADQKKTHEIIDTCKSACVKTSEMLRKVQGLANQAGANGRALESRGAQVSDAARSLLTTAQLTAHAVNSPACQAALLKSLDRLSSSIQELQTTWMLVVRAPKFMAVGEQLVMNKEAVEVDIAVLRRLVKEATEKANSEELVKTPTSPSQSKTNEEKLAKQQFTKSVQDAKKSISSAEEILQTAFVSDGNRRASLEDAQILALNKQMEHKLARANAAVAHLLACRAGGDKSNYTLASKCVGAVSDLMPSIAADAITLADQKDPVGRKLFLSDTLGLCTASKNLCETAKNDKKKLKEVALEFGNQSSKLLYAISTDIDPSQEKQVLLRVKAAGDLACRVTEGSVEGPAAGRCAGQATLLMYTAKLVAPSIQDPECQDALITASKDLSTQLKTIKSTNPKLTQELVDLENILEALRSDVASGKLVKRKEEKLVIEDTPLRRLTAKIIEDCKQNAEDTSNPASERKAMADFANQLTDALKNMDVANARCKKAPHDLRRREELEDAVLNLQHLVLQCRPRGGEVDASQSNIVNLSDFLKDVSAHAERLQRAADAEARGAGPHVRAAAAARDQCARLLAAAAPAQRDVPMVDVDHVAKECVSCVQKINTTIECCPEGAGKKNLRSQAHPLNESCTLLQFASQSALATAQCAALDEALNDLADLEDRIDKMLQPRQGEKHIAQAAPSASLLASRARLATAAAAVNREAQELAPAFTRYVADMRAHVDVTDEQKRSRLADHLKKLHDRLKLLTMETGRQVVTWRPANEGDVVAVTDEILRELENADEIIGAKTDRNNTIAYEDLKKLLLPVDTYTMEGDKKKLEAKLEPYATKLNSMAETLTLSVGKPGSLARTAHVTAESAVQLTALAKALKSDEDPTKNSKIDETSQELCFVTYNLLKTAESVGNEPTTFESRRRMIDACRSLSDAINKLVRASSSGDKLQRECNELNRALQLRQSTLQPRPTCALPYAECISALQTQHEAIKNLKSEEPVSREEFSASLDYLASAVNNNVEYAEHCAYLLSLSEQHPELSKDGMVDTGRIQKLIANAQESCFRITRPGIVHQAKEESSLLSKQLADLKQSIQESSSKVRDESVKRHLLEASSGVEAAGTKLHAELNSSNLSVESLTPSAFATIEALSTLRSVTAHPSLAPASSPSPAAQKRADEVIQQSKELLTRASGLMRAIKTSEDQQAMTWVMFNTYTKGVIEISEKLVTCIRDNGQQAGLIEGGIEEDDGDMTAVSYVQTQVLIANKWLLKPTYKAQIKTNGEQAARNVIDVGKKIMTHLKETEREEMKHLVEECEQLLQQCSATYTLETGSVLMDRLKDLAKAIDRSIVTMVVEDLLEDEEPLADLDVLVDAERDEAKRKFLLERKIADLLAHLGRVTKTARVVADGRGDDAAELRQCTSQAELLAPMLVKAAERRVIHHNDTAVAEEYRTQLAQYSQSLSQVRDLCDRAVDPMQFVQTAEEAMQRMKEESSAHQNDLQKCSNTSTAIRKLAHRVINVSMSSTHAQRDPELMRALTAAQDKLRGAAPAALRASRLPDWRSNIAEILRATGEVESVLGGEMIFQKQRETDQPIFNAALNLHAAVREWSARDNEIVAVAKRMAVLMAKLSDHMHADKKREVILTSKAIVAASHEVARLARKLALECTDMRIRTNLLQVCDQIPTISGQLKMLTTVKGSFLGQQGSDEDIEAMNMLIGNAQNLMMSIQDVVKAAASASVKIRSQRGGPKMRWVRKNYH